MKLVTATTRLTVDEEDLADPLVGCQRELVQRLYCLTRRCAEDAEHRLLFGEGGRPQPRDGCAASTDVAGNAVEAGCERRERVLREPGQVALDEEGRPQVDVLLHTGPKLAPEGPFAHPGKPDSSASGQS